MKIARVAIVAGLLGSVVFLLRSTGQGAGVVLRLVMTAWVVAPFVGLELAQRVLGRALPMLALAVAVASLAVYATNAITPLSPKAAFVFVIVPLGAWVVILFATSVAWISARR